MCKEIRFCLGFAQPVTGRRAYDGPSCRSSQGSETQYFHQGSVTVRHTCDGPSCHSITKFRESFPVPNSQELKCFETVDHDGSSCL